VEGFSFPETFPGFVTFNRDFDILPGAHTGTLPRAPWSKKLDTSTW